MTEIRTEHSFDVGSPPDEVWARLRAVRDRELVTPSDADWWMPGWTSRCTVLSMTDDRLEVRKEDEPCAGTSIVVEVEHSGTGSRIRIVQSGFDAGFVDAAGESFWIHAEHIAADFEVYVRRGVVAGRAWSWPRVDLGVSARSGPGGVEIESVAAGSWGESVGLVGQDLLLAVGGAPLFTLQDLHVVAHLLSAGDDVSVAFERDGGRREATAAV